MRTDYRRQLCTDARELLRHERYEVDVIAPAITEYPMHDIIQRAVAVDEFYQRIAGHIYKLQGDDCRPGPRALIRGLFCLPDHSIHRFVYLLASDGQCHECACRCYVKQNLPRTKVWAVIEDRLYGSGANRLCSHIRGLQ